MLFILSLVHFLFNWESSSFDPQTKVPTIHAALNPTWNSFSNSLSSSLTHKLDRNNYLSWKSQVVPTVIDHDLDQILFSDVTPPGNLVTGAPNPKYVQWKKERSIAPILVVIIDVRINSCFNGYSEFLISVLFNKAQAIADALSIAGSPITNQDLVLHLLNGLGLEFNSVVSSITSRSDLLLFEEVQALLLSHETRLEHHNSVVDLSLTLQANLTFQQSRNGNYCSYGRVVDHGNTTDSNCTCSYGRATENQLLCQVCLRIGHTDAVYHYRFDEKRVTPKYGNFTQAHLTESDIPYDPQAPLTTTILEIGNDWYVDIGATDHVDNDMAHLDTAAPYKGTETMVVVNGKKLAISSIGQSTLLSLLNTHSLRINFVLHVHSLKKNLISVSQLTNDNDVFLKFTNPVVFSWKNSQG
uniref:Retrovirus-related Pol polyprotein from transposon TNT 1-94-like beta-barrel domain-containing protein n=1 Tax=Cannabis sativa TaxID=3483 RepID=A0A803PEN8_CANSA